MTNRKFIIVTLMLGLLALSAVSAENNATDETVSLSNESDIEVVQSDETDDTLHSGYWVLSKDRDNLNLDDMSEKGVTDIFLNFKSYEIYGKDNLESWIANASDRGIRTHIWTQIFWTSKTGWVLPVVDSRPNTDFFNEKIAELNEYASLKGLSGIHMDYLRYSGSAEYTDEGKQAITDFVMNATSSIRKVNPNLTVSAALMPDLKRLQNTYGVDYPVISRYFDVIVPMLYSGNFKKDRDWISQTTRQFISNSNGARIWTGLQSYVNDNDLSHLTMNQINADIRAAIDSKASGVVIFRFGVSEDIDFNYAFNLVININAKSASYIANYGGKYQTVLKDAKGNPVPFEKVTFLLNGKKLASVLTDSSGKAKIKLTSKFLKKAKIGKNKLTVKLSNGKSKTVRITLKKETPKLRVSKIKGKLKITLKNSKNRPIKKSKITVKVKNKKYYLRTNAKGKVTFKIKAKGRITVIYRGTKYIKGVSRKA